MFVFNKHIIDTGLNSVHLESSGMCYKMQSLFNRHILKVAGCVEDSQRILDNNSASGLAEAIAKAWELYGSKR